MKRFRKPILLFAVILLFLIGLIFTAVYLKSVADYKKAVRETAFHNINISNVPDGVYVGEYDVDFVYAKVEVTVQNGVMTNIDILEHKNGRGKPAEAVADRIVFLDRGEIVEMDSPQEFFTAPKTERAQKFLNTFTFEIEK